MPRPPRAPAAILLLAWLSSLAGCTVPSAPAAPHQAATAGAPAVRPAVAAPSFAQPLRLRLVEAGDEPASQPEPAAAPGLRLQLR
ncbi:MAG: hypothetical protein R3B72_46720 [Polyangiaceae bacterium]